MLEWLRNHVPAWAPIYASIISALAGIWLFLRGQHAREMEEERAEQMQRWKDITRRIERLGAISSRHETQLSQTMTRAEVAHAIQESADGLVSQISGRLDRTDRHRERFEESLKGDMRDLRDYVRFIASNVTRTREDFPPYTTTPLYRPHLVDPGTDTNKGKTDE